MTQHTIDRIINQLANVQNLNKLWICGFKQLKPCIYDYLQNIENWSLQDIDNETVQIEVFEFAYLDNDNRMVVRASSNYYGQAAFSDVCVEMDKAEQDDYLTDNGLCYAKVCINK
jgi:hypothetical protein